MNISIIDIALMALVVYLLFKISKLEHRIQAMTYTINQLTDKVKLPEPPVNKELRKLIKEGKEVEAVREARQAFGLSLVEGKQYIEDLKTKK